MNYAFASYLFFSLVVFIHTSGMEQSTVMAIERLRSHQVDTTKINPFAMTPLYVHCRRGRPEDIKIASSLLDNGADPNKTPSFNSPALTKAIDRADAGLVQLLCAYNVNINHKGIIAGRTPLIDAIRGGRLKIVGILLQHEADANIPDALGSYPLHEALLMSQQKQGFPVLEIIKMLFEHKADTTRQNEYKQTPLALAQHFKCPPEIITLFVSRPQEPLLQRSQSSSAKRKPMPTPPSVLKRRSIEVT